jgi:hypothetical protein
LNEYDVLKAKPETWHDTEVDDNEAQPAGTVPTAQPVAHLTLHVRKLQLLLLPGVQPNMIVVEDEELKTGARRTGAAAGKAVDTVALVAE